MFLVYLFAVQSFAQTMKFENFTTSEGLSNNSVIDIENDKDGGLWIATWDGLNYYDGYKFKVFKHNISDNKTISSNYIVKLQKDANGFLWLISKEGDVNKYIGNGKFEKFMFKTTPKKIFLSKKGNIIVETSIGFYEFNNTSFDKIPIMLSKDEDYSRLKNILLTKYPSLTINDVLKDKSGNIWFATRKNGLFIIDNTTGINNIEHFTNDCYLPYAFKSDEIETLHEDLFGNIWLGQKDGGISMAFAGSEKIASVLPHPIKQPYLPNETIRAITKEPNGKTWLGYYTKGLYYHNENSRYFEKFKIKEATLNPDWDRIRTLFTASDGTIWAGTYSGIIRIKGDKYTCYESKNIKELPNDRSYSICEDEEKQLWIACWGGVAKYNLKNEKFETFRGQSLVNGYHIRSVRKNNQTLILGTESSGVLLFDLKTNTLDAITTKKRILGNSIYSVFIDNASDNYWIASLGGISVFNKEKGIIRNITEANGLPSHMVYGLIDNGNKVWISTTKGIASIDKKSFKVTVFNPNYGWQDPEFSEGAYYQDPEGILFFGGVNGLNYFNPNTLQADNSNVKIKLIIDGNENYHPIIEKSFTDNNLEITLIPIQFPKNNKNNIYYKLEGEDKNWVLLDSTNTIKYTSLSSGKYRFLIKEGASGKVKPLFFTLHITKAFYETILFYVLLSGFILIACLVFIYYKNKITIGQQKLLEAQILARTEVIENQKKDLEAINEKLDQKNQKISDQKEKLLLLHTTRKNENFEIEKFKTFMLSEFQEPISQILKISSTLKNDTEVQCDMLTQLGKLMNLISGWNYLDHVKDIGPVKKSAINLFLILKKSIGDIEQDLKQNQVNFNCELDASICFVEIDVLRLKLLLQYFFNDLSKYSDPESTLNIKIVYEKNNLEVRVISDSEILKNNWDNITHYSPYFKAMRVLLQDLKGEFSSHLEEQFQTILQVPLDIIDPEIEMKETISWNHFNQSKPLALNKHYLLVFSDQSNYSTANQVLENDNYELLFESSVANLNAILKQINVSALVFYQATLSKELLKFLNTSQQTKDLNIPMIYIAETINYELNELLLELGIETLIQLPARKSFIMKKMASLIEKKKELIEEKKIQRQLFQIVTEDDTLVTSNDKLLKKALEIIREQLQDSSFNVETLIEHLGISRVKCYRLFKETLKQSPSDIITSLRLQKAEVLFKTKKLNISEVSFECGYNDPKYFARSFKKYFGKSPKEYQQHSI